MIGNQLLRDAVVCPIATDYERGPILGTDPGTEWAIADLPGLLLERRLRIEWLFSLPNSTNFSPLIDLSLPLTPCALTVAEPQHRQ